MTQHPTPEQVQTVIDNLKKIEAQANQDGAFDIEEQRVHYKDHACGTVHCVAGWYAVANKDAPSIRAQMKENYCLYDDGANHMANRLGFGHYEALEDFMADHPEIWGNDYGEEMFCSTDAYNGLEHGSQNPMTIIINHWQQVKKNLENLTQG